MSDPHGKNPEERGTPFTPVNMRSNPSGYQNRGPEAGSRAREFTPATTSTASTLPYSAAQFRSRLEHVSGSAIPGGPKNSTPNIAERLASRMAARRAREVPAVKGISSDLPTSNRRENETQPRMRSSILSREVDASNDASILSPMARSKLALKHMKEFEVSSSLLSQRARASSIGNQSNTAPVSVRKSAFSQEPVAKNATPEYSAAPSAFLAPATPPTASASEPSQTGQLPTELSQTKESSRGTSQVAHRFRESSQHADRFGEASQQAHRFRETTPQDAQKFSEIAQEANRSREVGKDPQQVKEVTQESPKDSNPERSSAVSEYLRVVGPRFGNPSNENKPSLANKAFPAHSLTDNHALEMTLAQDPRVLKYGSRITLRSFQGTFVCVGRKQTESLDTNHLGVPSTDHQVARRSRALSTSSLSSLSGPESVLFIHASGSPAERGAVFTVVSTQLRQGRRPVKFGDTVALCSTASDGRYLGVYANASSEEGGPIVGLSQKTVGQNESWTVVRVENSSFEREAERLERIEAEEKHLMQRAKDLGVSQRISLADHQVPVSVRSSDAIVLRSCSRLAKGWVLSLQGGRLSSKRDSVHYGLGLSPEQVNNRQQHSPTSQWFAVAHPSPFVPSWTRERIYLVGKSLGAKHAEREQERAKTLTSAQRTQQKLENLSLSTEHADDIAREVETSMIQPLHSLPLAEQEFLMVEDILFALQGIEGSYVRCRSATSSAASPRKQGRAAKSGSVGDKPEDWDVDPRCGLDASFRALAHKMLPLAAHYVQVNQFVECRTRYEYGTVSHALCAVIRELVSEFDLLVAQLEHQHRSDRLSLHKLWFYLQPSLRTMQVLGTVAEQLGTTSHGGQLLNVLHQISSTSGDAKGAAIFQHLISRACEPYLGMLELWVYHGTIRDPYNEFMVQVDEETTKTTLKDDFNARYWDSKYTIRGDQATTMSDALQHTRGEGTPEVDQESNAQVPFFLRRVAESVLTTGKYLNVIRECGRWISPPFATKIRYSDEDYAYDQIVQEAHVWASTSLLDLLLGEEKLMECLRSIKHSFLLDQGDFFVHFMDVAKDELARPVHQISLSRIQSLLEMCLRVRDVNDQFQEDLTCELVPYTLIQHVEAIHEFAAGDVASDVVQVISDVFAVDERGAAAGGASVAASALTGFDAFTLDFKVQWPVSLVLSRQALTKYQLIFRHLFFCKHVERQLCNTWQSHQTTKELGLRSTLGPDYCLRQRMLHFLQNYEYYIMFEVLEPRWHELEQRLQEVRTVDELMKHHAEFLDTCLRECLLTHQGLLKTLAKLMTTCLLFAEQVGRFAEQLRIDEESMMKAIREADPDCMPETKNRKEARRQSSTLRRTRIKVQSDHIKGIFLQQSYRQMIMRSQKTFDEMLRSFMASLLAEAAHGEFHSHLSNLVTRLDFNSYYQQSSGNQE